MYRAVNDWFIFERRMSGGPADLRTPCLKEILFVATGRFGVSGSWQTPRMQES